MSASLMDIIENGKNAIKVYNHATTANSANMGHVDTIGYKGIRYAFQTVFNQVLTGGSQSGLAGMGGTDPMQLGSTTAISHLNINFEQGDIQEGGDMSLAILGNGLFILSEDGGKSFLYTRAGDFSVNRDGFVVDPSGRKLYGYPMDAQGNTIKSKLVPIKTSGHTDVGWDYKNKTGILITNYQNFKNAKDYNKELPKVQKLYQVAITSFTNLSGLLQHDGTTFKKTFASGNPLKEKLSGQEYGTIYSQSLEKSNVFYIGEMLDAQAIQQAQSAMVTAVKFASNQIQSIIQQLGS